MRIVAALGGNALLERDEKPDAGIQLRHIRTAAQALAPLAEHNDLVICHGNGPQIGMLALESTDDASLTHPYPLDVLGAQTQGMIGYWLAQSLRNVGVTKRIVSLITQTLVDADDPAFAEPTKFVGPEYSRANADKLARRHGWRVAADGAQWRRVVPSPRPQRIVEQDSITQLLRTGSVVICGGGGGAPVITDDHGQLCGVEAVIDKDFTAALLAITVDADRLLVLTDVAAVLAHFGTPQAVPLHNVDLDELADVQFPAGSMGPKIDACRQFVAATGRAAAIGSLSDAAAILAGSAGTTITLGATRSEDPRIAPAGRARAGANHDRHP